MDFKTAVEETARGVRLEDIAQELMVPEAQIRQALLDPSDRFYRPPPPTWKRAVARLAWERGGLLHALARKLEQEAEVAIT
ncbi:MAG: hypothetical protein ACE5JR_11240 [Gemmatimonadota bacterium]